MCVHGHLSSRTERAKTNRFSAFSPFPMYLTAFSNLHSGRTNQKEINGVPARCHCAHWRIFPHSIPIIYIHASSNDKNGHCRIQNMAILHDIVPAQAMAKVKAACLSLSSTKRNRVAGLGKWQKCNCFQLSSPGGCFLIEQWKNNIT